MVGLRHGRDPVRWGQNGVVRRLALTLLALAGGVALAVGPAGPAHAHASLESSVPAGSSILDAAPTDITLDFDEPVSTTAGGIRLIDSSGKDIALGASEQGADPSVLITPVPEIPNGAYVVAWEIISQDGHPADGAFAFQVGRDGAIDTRGLIASVLSQQGGDGAVEQLATFNRLLSYTGLALAIGGAVFVVAIWPGAASRWAARRLVWFGWGLLLVATTSTLLVAGPYLTGRTLGGRARLRPVPQRGGHSGRPDGRAAPRARAPRPAPPPPPRPGPEQQRPAGRGAPR